MASLGALALPLQVRAAQSGKRLLIFFNNGGWDPTFVFDPHFESDVIEGDPNSVAASAGGIDFADAESRPSVRSFFENYGSRCAVVNGINVNSISHSQCLQVIMTGSRDPGAADLPVALAAQIGASLTLPHLVVSGPRYPGQYSSFMVSLSRTLTGTNQGLLPEGVAFGAQEEDLIRAFLQEEAERLTGDGADDLFHQYQASLSRQTGMSSVALDVSANPTFEEQMSNAVSALASGLSSSVILQGDLPEFVTWDSHNDNYFKQDSAFEHTFQRVNSLLSQLESTQGPDGGPLLDQTMVVMLSEMGRTPRYNMLQGKDHWPFTSALLVGAGVAGGQVVGATDSGMSGMTVDFSTGEAASTGSVLEAAAFLAGILSSFDVDPGLVFPDAVPFLAPFQ